MGAELMSADVAGPVARALLALQASASTARRRAAPRPPGGPR